MSYVTINGTEYQIPELNFDAVCELEEYGVYLLSMTKEDRRFATMIRGLAAWIMKTDKATASREIQEHIRKGGNVVDILDALNDAMEESGFFNQDGGEVQQFQQNRQQRRNSQRNQRRNTHPSQN